MDVVFAVNNFGDTRSGGLAGPMGLFLIVLMCVATVLLIRNMNKRIRRLPDSFPVAGERDRVAQIAQDAAGAGSSGAAAAAEVEPDRSGPAAGPAEAEVAGVSEEQSGSAPGDGRERS
ncbi:hypothetical protein KZ829_01880 [Actinoplanes hulinensis]|uniref:Uncharacterized protein n=2 Tax=Actinoplanes hulinensis TaxID=1144547 RepID=A0ABS7AUZ0_9ACTN|nr:hypothetical protein [Actinoplanes hulinensis]